MKVDLNNKVALVTGASGAIGSAIAIAFAENGADVVVNVFSNLEKGKKVAEKIESLGRKAIVIRADVSNLDDMVKMHDQVMEEFGRLDILVNNAGINGGPDQRKTINEYSVDLWKKIISTDLDGVFYCSRPFTSQMIKQRYGKIINIGSIVGLVPLRLQCAFAAAKAGVFNLTKAMAIELAKYGINVNGIAPGSILMEGTKDLFYNDPELANKMMATIPFGRPGKPDDIANAALFLASDDSNYMTGSILVVDGGWTCGYARDF